MVFLRSLCFFIFSSLAEIVLVHIFNRHWLSGSFIKQLPKQVLKQNYLEHHKGFRDWCEAIIDHTEKYDRPKEFY